MNAILAWAGGKRQLLPEILRLLPDDAHDRRFHEPMIGGGAVFFGLEPSSGTINDVNSDLIAFYRAVKKNPEKVIELANNHQYSEDYYYKKREEYNQRDLNNFEQAALFLYFNKAAYNSLWRVNSSGEFNVPFGDPKDFDSDKIRRASEILSGISIKEGDFKYVFEETNPGDIVYFDPPYPAGPNSPNYNKYTVDEFDMEDQERLLQCCKKLADKGVYFVLSNGDTEEIRDLVSGVTPDFSLTEVGARRWISCGPSSKADELLITNIPKEEWSEPEQRSLES